MNLLSNLSSHLFWDVSTRTLDPEKHKHYIIPRVADRGTLEEVHLLINYYGMADIRDVLLSAPALDKKTVSYFAFYFGCSESDFKAYHTRRNWPLWR